MLRTETCLKAARPAGMGGKRGNKMGSIVVDLGPDPTTGLNSYPTQANAISNSVVAARNNALLLNANARRRASVAGS